MEIGSKMRELRIYKGMSIRELAEKAKCTSSLISQIERGKTEPSISMLKRIADALNVNIVDFFMPEFDDGDLITKPEERVAVHLDRWDAKIYSLIKNFRNKKMQPFYTVIKPGGGSHGMYKHEGEEFGYVMKGTMDLILNERVFKVKEGESFYFSSKIPHSWGNSGNEDVIVLWVITPPTF
jgi:transcriptional regulator with XRE-family HTH domain